MVLREPGGGIGWHVLADPGGKRVLRIHRVMAVTSLRGAPGRLLALALLSQLPAGQLSHQQAQRPRSTSRSWGQDS